MPNIHKTNGAVKPESYKYSPKNMLSPDFSSGAGYNEGDIVVFHCLTQHEANPHVGNKDGSRVSLDGRVFARLDW